MRRNRAWDRFVRAEAELAAAKHAVRDEVLRLMERDRDHDGHPITTTALAIALGMNGGNLRSFLNGTRFNAPVAQRVLAYYGYRGLGASRAKPQRPRGTPAARLARNERIHRLFHERGLTFAEIGRRVQLSGSQVSVILGFQQRGDAAASGRGKRQGSNRGTNRGTRRR